MKNLKKKGFTIVELVIVIAVIAILAAVLIPTFSSLVKKAQISADQQAVTQMNKILLVEEKATGIKPQTLGEVIEILQENGVYDYEPYYSNYSVKWIIESNVIVLVENEKVVFPDQYKDSEAVRKCLSLDKMEVSDMFEELGNESDPYIVSSSKELELLSSFVNSGKSLSGKYFKLENDIDMSNVKTWDPIGTKDNPFDGNFDGASKSIKNWTTDSSFFGVVKGTRNVKLTGTKDAVLDANNNLVVENVNENNYTCVIKNVKFENCNYTVNKSENGFISAVVEDAYVGNCEISNCKIEIKDTWKSGIMFGDIRTSYVTGLCLKADNTITCSESVKTLGNFGMLIGTVNFNDHTTSSRTIVENCVNEASVKLYHPGNTGYIGGVIGYADGIENVIINCMNKGNIDMVHTGSENGKFSIGGILGAHRSGDVVNFINCKNIGSITVSGVESNNTYLTHNIMAGICAYAKGTYIKCVNSGNLTGNVRTIAAIGLMRGSSKNQPSSNMSKYPYVECTISGVLTSTRQNTSDPTYIIYNYPIN